MALRTLADIEAAGATLPFEQGWPPSTQAQADRAAALLAPWLPRLAVQPQAA